MRLSVVLHILIACVFAAVTAISCRVFFLLPFWLGGILGVLLYLVIVAGIKTEDWND